MLGFGEEGWFLCVGGNSFRRKRGGGEDVRGVDFLSMS